MQNWYRCSDFAYIICEAILEIIWRYWNLHWYGEVRCIVTHPHMYTLTVVTRHWLNDVLLNSLCQLPIICENFHEEEKHLLNTWVVHAIILVNYGESRLKMFSFTTRHYSVGNARIMDTTVYCGNHIRVMWSLKTSFLYVLVRHGNARVVSFRRQELIASLFGCKKKCTNIYWILLFYT